MCSTDVYCSKQTGQCSRKPSLHHFFRFWIGRRNCRCSQNLWRRRKNVVKTETQQTFVNGLLGFITLGIYTRWKRVCIVYNNRHWVAHRYGQLYLHCSLIYFWVPSSCFCIVISLSLRRNNPVQRCLPVGGSNVLSTPEAVRLHALTDRLLWCATDDDQRQHHHAEHHFQFCASANSRVFCIERSNITLTHLHVSNCRVRQLLVLWHFWLRWAL